MYIKSLTISGFKSYRDPITVTFHKGSNVVVGRNGSGKSNFFSAVRFVLADSYTSLQREERNALLHEGSGTTQTFSAYVEIVFDNSDGRFPTGKDTLTLRRTIGAKKDDYQLDRKSTSKGEVMSMLESAGFSRSNPYYIVPQGRITHLTNLKDAERLDLLKEVAGTKVYEDRRAESLKIMEETDHKRTKIDELLKFIEERLGELEEEKEELKEFQSKDRDRRCLEYSIYQRDLEEVSEALEEIEGERKKDRTAAANRMKDFAARQKAISVLEADISTLNQDIELLKMEAKQLSADRQESVKVRTQLQCLIRDSEENRRTTAESRDSWERELDTIERQIVAKEAELMEILPNLDAIESREIEIRQRYAQTKASQDLLYAKQGRSSQFRTQADRDRFLNAEITELNSRILSHRQRIETEQQAIGNHKQSLQTAERRAADIGAELEGRADNIRRLKEELESVKVHKEEKNERKKELWKEQMRAGQVEKTALEESRKSEGELRTMMDKQTSAGLRALERIVNQLQLDGVYGPVYELFTVEDHYRTAVEVTAGNSLFHVVCDTDETVQKILSKMNQDKSGRLTFIPLNRVRTKQYNYPSTGDAIPMIKKLQFDPQVTRAMENVFGRSLICRSMKVAADFTRSHNLDGITLEGDRVDRRGTLTGGYQDPSRSRLQAVYRVQREKKALAETKKHLQELSIELNKVTGESNVLQNQQDKLERELGRILGRRDELVLAEKRAIADREALESLIKKSEYQIKGYEREILVSERSVEGLQKELQVPMQDVLNAQEKKILADMTVEVEKSNAEMKEIINARSELEGKKNDLDVELRENLKRRREELRANLEALDDPSGFDAGDVDVAARVRELGSITKRIDDQKRRIDAISTEIEKKNTELSKKNTELEKLQGEHNEESHAMERQHKNVERYMTKKQLLTNKKEECQKSIRDLGVLPEEAFEKYTQIKVSEKLIKQLHKVNEALKKFGHVNKKAFEQYSQFTKQKEQLVQRRQELDESATSIEELVEVLDQRKDEAIERTFKQVSKYFEEVFEKLVPAGRGRLIMQKRIDEPDENEDEEMEVDGKTKASKIDNYIGVSIKVSFNSKVDEGLRIQQLSGGQKSLVALAMVFAIQKCDPAPFYLFDEIDANLDADRRTAVAAMIHELSSSAQFIITTFRPELITQADEFLGVTFDARKVSSIAAIDKGQASTFVEANERAGQDSRDEDD